MADKETKVADKLGNTLDALFKAGVHFGYDKSRRHPSTKNYIFGNKNRVELFDLEKTNEALDKALHFIEELGRNNKVLLFAASKFEALEALRATALALDLPYMAGRWVGGVFTNFGEIKKRVAVLEKLREQKEAGELSKYTKKERLMIDREIARLEKNFAGIVSMKDLPAALFVIDPKTEHIAVREAKDKNIPVLALANSDCDVSLVTYAIPGNDASKGSIAYVLSRVVEAYKKGKVNLQ
mgnify:CR=1 FL=1